MTAVVQLETFATPDVEMERRADGSVILKSRHPLNTWVPSIPAVLRSQAAAHPDRPLAAQRDAQDRWVPLTYGEARAKADALAQAFLDLGLGPERPVMILSPNSLDHLLVTLGAFTAGVPVMPISVAYSLMSADHRHLTDIAALARPGLVFAEDAGPFKAALDAIEAQTRAGLEQEVGDSMGVDVTEALGEDIPDVLISRGDYPGAFRLSEMLGRTPSGAVDDAVASIEPDTVAKVLFTSGSTGKPKGVITTQRMLCSNQAALLHCWPFMSDEPPVLVDWLPWSHTFGGSHDVNMVLFNGGTMYIDDGKPAPPLFPRTVAALRDVSPTVYLNVPAGYALLAPALEADRDLAKHFFSRLRFMFYAAAALPPALADRMRKLAAECADHEVPLTSAWGATETSPAATEAHFVDAVMGCIGVPMPGTTIKLAPVGEKLEIRVSGPNVAPGYFRRPDLAETAFDEEGFYCSGDAVKLVDENDPNKGMLFDGRIAEDFKLMTGTWVTAGPLRMSLLSTARVLTDAVMCGHDTSHVSALGWVNQAEARKLWGGGAGAGAGEADIALDDPRLREHLSRALAILNEGQGSASRVERLLLLATPPNLDADEITDKGYINQRACRESRAAQVAQLYADEPGSEVITPAG